MKEFKTIDFIKVEVTDSYSDNGAIQCFLERGKFGCSLSLAEDFGTIEEDGPKVSDETLAKIRKFAESRGY